MRQLSLSEQEVAPRGPEMRRRLIEPAHRQADDGGHGMGPEACSANYDHLFVMDSGLTPHRSVAEVVRERSQDPVETIMDLALEKGNYSASYSP